MIVRRSNASYARTVASLVEAITSHGLTLFARVDHAAGARAAGLELADEELFVLGNAQTGTPLMAGDPRIGIELPLKMLVWREADDVLVGFRDPRELAVSYDVGAEETTLERMATLLDRLATEAAGTPVAE